MHLFAPSRLQRHPSDSPTSTVLGHTSENTRIYRFPREIHAAWCFMHGYESTTAVVVIVHEEILICSNIAEDVHLGAIIGR